jgi:hypothetical protein
VTGIGGAGAAAAGASAAAGAMTRTTTIAKGAMHMMTLAKTKLVAGVVAAAVVVAGVGGVISMNRADAHAQDGQAATATRSADQAAGARGAARDRTTPAAADEPRGGGDTAAATATAKGAAGDAADKPNPRGGFSVRTSPPVVVSTEPMAGATDVDAAVVTEIKVTFSKDMQNGNWAFAQMSKESFPQTTGKPRYLDYKRTCVLPVKLEPGRTYVIALNKRPFDSFMDTDHRKAMEYLLVFETKK